MARFLDEHGLETLWTRIKQFFVAKETGKGLSTNDYTDADKAKVATALQAETDPTVSSWAKAQTKPTYTASEVGAIPSTDKGANGGVATLDSSGKVPQSQLPSYVDDVLEYANRASFPATGENGKIYVAIDTNKTYRWSGSAYVEIAQGLALGETSSTAFAGDRGKAIEDKIPLSASASNKLLTERERHFKGWFNSLPELEAEHTAIEGDSAYVKDASPATTWSIYVYDSTASSDNYWADSGTDADTTHVQTFETGEKVNSVGIDDEPTAGSENLVESGGTFNVLEKINKPYSEPVVIQDSFTSCGTYTNTSSKETIVEENNVYTYSRITTRGSGFYIGPLVDYDYTKQHYLYFDYTFKANQVGNHTYVCVRKGKTQTSTLVKSSIQFAKKGSGSSFIQLPKTDPSATLYICVSSTGTPVGEAGIILSNIRLVKEDDITLIEKIEDVEENVVPNFINENHDEEPTADSTNLMLSGDIYNAFVKNNKPFAEPVVLQNEFNDIGFEDSKNEITFTKDENNIYTLTRTGTSGSGRCWIGVIDNYSLSKTTKLIFDVTLADTHVANYTYFQVRTGKTVSSTLCGQTLVHTKGTHHVEILLNKTDAGKYFGFQYTGIPKHTDGSAVLTISNMQLIQYDESTISEILDNLMQKTDTIDLEAPQIAKSNDTDKTKNLLSQFTRVIGSQTIKPLVILHFSDLHGSVENITRINQYRSYYNKYIDATIHTGDLILSHWDHDTDFYFNDDNNADILNVVGNHDVMAYYNSAYHADHVGKDCYDRFFAPFIDNWGVTQPENAAENGYCWYYKDFTASNIRLIVIDVMNNIDAQKAWFADILEDARVQGLHVVSAAHYRFTDSINIDSVFTQRNTINAPSVFIDNDYLIMVKSFKDNGGTFVCWLNGHHHADAIQKSSDVTGNQLSFNVNTSGDGAQVKKSPINRVGIDRNIDSFNILAIDTVYHVISLFKVGSEFDKWGRRFGTFCINYETNDIIWND